MELNFAEPLISPNNSFRQERNEAKIFTKPFLRYPGGKQRLLRYILPYVEPELNQKNRYLEPFVGGASIYFALNPSRAILSDLNADLMDLYIGIRKSPKGVWKAYKNFPDTKEGYYSVRVESNVKVNTVLKAARLLYLNRTCFKGMWRHNSKGEFTVGYGGQDRRWVISQDSLSEVSSRLKNSSLIKSDFETMINFATTDDFLFLDPPYRPFYRDIREAHYVASKFTFSDQLRLAKALSRATKRGVKWAMTNSSHPDLVKLYKKNNTIRLPKGTGRLPGQMISDSGEVMIMNY